FMRLSDGDSDYKAMQLFLSRRQGRLRSTLSYTLSRANDNASGNGDNPEAYLDKNYNYGPTEFDRPLKDEGATARAANSAGRAVKAWTSRCARGSPCTATRSCRSRPTSSTCSIRQSSDSAARPRTCRAADSGLSISRRRRGTCSSACG